MSRISKLKPFTSLHVPEIDGNIHSIRFEIYCQVLDYMEIPYTVSGHMIKIKDVELNSLFYDLSLKFFRYQYKSSFVRLEVKIRRREGFRLNLTSPTRSTLVSLQKIKEYILLEVDNKIKVDMYNNKTIVLERSYLNKLNILLNKFKELTINGITVYHGGKIKFSIGLDTFLFTDKNELKLTSGNFFKSKEFLFNNEQVFLSFTNEITQIRDMIYSESYMETPSYLLEYTKYISEKK